MTWSLRLGQKEKTADRNQLVICFYLVVIQPLDLGMQCNLQKSKSLGFLGFFAIDKGLWRQGGKGYPKYCR